MISWDWNDALGLPDAALAGYRRIPKAVLARQALLTRTEQRTLDKVRSLSHFATVQKSTTRILPLVDETHDVQSVVFLHCDMAGSQAHAEVARLVHKCFPNPTVILFGGAGAACISVALTRKSRSEQGAIVVERVENTGTFDAHDERYAPFLESLAFASLPQESLLAFLEAIASKVQLSKAIGVLGYFPTCDVSDTGKLFDLLDAFEAVSLTAKEKAVKRKTDKDLTLNESSKLRMEQKKLEKTAAELAERIKEICHERG
jgi:hypothetical protein